MNAHRTVKFALAVTLLIVVAALTLTCDRIYLSERSNDHDEKSAAPHNSSIADADALPVVTLATAAQIQSGIRIAVLTPHNYRRETVAYGSVVDLQPLIDYRTRVAAAHSAAETARAIAQASEAEYERNRILYGDNQNVSLKTLQAARATAAADRAKAVSALLSETDLRAAATQQFGKTLATSALITDAQLFKAFLKRDKVLLMITLPLGENLTAPSTIEISAYTLHRTRAVLLSSSPQSDPVLPGRSYFYYADTTLPTNTRIVAYLPLADTQQRGLFVPTDAQVWYGGQSWVYIQLDKNRFTRRAVSRQASGNDGFYVTRGFKPGDAIVVRGAQLLLSEEFRAQIKSGEEGDDDDD